MVSRIVRQTKLRHNCLLDRLTACAATALKSDLVYFTIETFAASTS
jgi:hypothetical protein